ncbi:DUF1506 family protein [Borrelia persica]|uniref:DUF1506 family protein n=1 Tax=Borrelia persica TaxID=44448 RepID=UPI0004679F9D|nr:DUF1506 family protein [Borrelia persica]
MNLRSRLSQMANRMINTFREESLLRFYKGIYSKDEEFEDLNINFNKDTYREFVGIIIDITPQELANIETSNLYDSCQMSKLYTNEELDFEIKDRVSLNDNFYEIINIDGSVGYKTIILRSLEWI